MTQGMKRLLIYAGAVFGLSVAYFIYAYLQAPPTEERETFLSEIGEGLGELSLWLLIFIYSRTVLKLLMGKGPLSRRLLPDYIPPASASLLKKTVSWLDRTHVHAGIAAVALIALHTVFMGVPLSNLFFPAVLVLLLWQTAFGMFLRWRSAPRNLKSFSYSVHAQLLTGIMIGLFGYFGHMLV